MRNVSQCSVGYLSHWRNYVNNSHSDNTTYSRASYHIEQVPATLPSTPKALLHTIMFAVDSTYHNRRPLAQIELGCGCELLHGCKSTQARTKLEEVRHLCKLRANNQNDSRQRESYNHPVQTAKRFQDLACGWSLCWRCMGSTARACRLPSLGQSTVWWVTPGEPVCWLYFTPALPTKQCQDRAAHSGMLGLPCFGQA